MHNNWPIYVKHRVKSRGEVQIMHFISRIERVKAALHHDLLIGYLFVSDIPTVASHFYFGNASNFHLFFHHFKF